MKPNGSHNDRRRSRLRVRPIAAMAMATPLLASSVTGGGVSVAAAASILEPLTHRELVEASTMAPSPALVSFDETEDWLPPHIPEQLRGPMRALPAAAAPGGSNTRVYPGTLGRAVALSPSVALKDVRE